MRKRRLHAIFYNSFFVGLLAALSLPAFPSKAFCASSSGSVTGDKKVEDLLMTIRDAKLRESKPNRVVEAIQQLGRIKAAAAVDDLANLLTFARTWPWERPGGPIDEIHTVTPAGRYPAVGALMEIGRASLPALIRVIGTHEPSSLETQNAMQVVTYLFRSGRDAGVDYLKETAAMAPSPEAAQRLRMAAETLEKTKR